MKKLLILAGLFFSLVVLADTPPPLGVQIVGETIRFSKPTLDIDQIVKIITGATDPTVVAPESAPAGSIYVRTNGKLYTKQDAGISTNWQLVGSGGGGTWGSITGTLSSQTDLQAALNAKQDSLGFTPENVANKDTDQTLTANSDVKYASQKAVKSYIDAGLSGKQNSLGFTPENVANKTTDGTLAANSDTLYPSEKAVKTYADTKQSAIGYTPENQANKATSTSLGASDTLYPSQNAVKQYVDTGLSGKQNSLGFTAENVANKTTDGTLSANSDTLYPSEKAVKTYADTKQSALPVGSSSQYLRGDLTDQTLDTSVVPENGNLYYTSARFASDLATKSTSNITEGSNLYYTAARFNSAFSGKTTSDLTEGSNLYFTNARVASAIGFTPENVANKTTDGTFSANSDTLYPSEKASKTYVDNTLTAITSSFITIQERPSGTIDGSNTSFVLSQAPSVSSSLILSEDGGTLIPGGGNDFVVSGVNITMAQAPVVGQRLWAIYNGTYASIPNWSVESLTLSSTDITHQYKDLGFAIVSNSIDLSVEGLEQTFGVDYTVSLVGGVTRVSFAGNLATGGSTPLIAGNILNVQYQH